MKHNEITVMTGKEITVSVDRPVESFTGRVIAVVCRLNDDEDKWVVAPDGVTFTKEEIIGRIYFQEKYFDFEIIM